MLGFAALGFWLWYRTIHLYVPAAGEPPRCLTGLGGVLFLLLLAEVYGFLLTLWQWVLLQRRWEGIGGWVGTPWLLLVLSLLPVWLAAISWLGA